MSGATIRLSGLELPIHLGWPDDERAATQTVRADLLIEFPAVPRAATTDDLADTVDYGHLVDVLRGVAAERPYRLLEHFGARALAALRRDVGPELGLELTVTKFPAIEGLTGGASFTLRDPGR